eukprot:TRINITY_DN10917_c0_g1_i1.p3 TRINITY_DN10917_c0_g1~~TRINITY_DN10917_c0_g1_i1.p3  ORF type:complete len:112 (-),score=9.44 TRINITY_DN10917_c0_g1_i1:188-523(-)
MSGPGWSLLKYEGHEVILLTELVGAYMEATLDECNDTPLATPLFSWLSPHQRVCLASDILVGFTCPYEPFPPNTRLYHAAFGGLMEFLCGQIDVECDDQHMRIIRRRGLWE